MSGFDPVQGFRFTFCNTPEALIAEFQRLLASVPAAANVCAVPTETLRSLVALAARTVTLGDPMQLAETLSLARTALHDPVALLASELALDGSSEDEDRLVVYAVDRIDEAIGVLRRAAGEPD